MRVSYGRVEVIHGIDFDLAPGEVVGMIGPNGAGKTSVLRAVCGLLQPSAGQLLFEKRPLAGLTPEEIALQGLALVPEGRQIFRTLTVAENLQLGARAQQASGSRIDAMLERFPILRERARQRADRLSGGEQQQLAIARALLGEPKLLILDEPSLGLAPKMIDAVYELLGGLREEGVTMLLVEQNAARTIDFSDRCVVLSGGLIRVEGTRAELQRDPEVLRSYLGKQL
jgi:branched-chain amino acid transport system ATP-binding protein